MTTAELLEKQGFKKGIEQGIEQGIEKGIEKGIEQGLKQGIEKAREEDAIKMLKEGLDVSLIKKITGFSKSEIQKLKNDFSKK